MSEDEKALTAREMALKLNQRNLEQQREIARLTAEKAEALREFALRLQTKTDSYEEIFKQQREKIERLQTIGQDLHRKETEAAQRLYEERLWSNEARALLEEAHYWLDALAKHAARPTVEKIAAFLAQ